MKHEYNEEHLYESPEMKIYETRVQSVICQSRTGGAIGEMTQDDTPGSWD